LANRAKDKEQPKIAGLSLAEHFNSLQVVFSPRRAKKRPVIKKKYHAAAG
jgi:hypothetical protein